MQQNIYIYIGTDPVFAELEDMAGKNTSIPTSSILLLNPASFFHSEDDGIL